MKNDQFALKTAGKNVLWVEDQVIIGLHAKVLMESMGYNCELAHDAACAIKMIDTAYFDYVFSDIDLGGMSGLELAKYISQNHSTIRVIIVSARNISSQQECDHGITCSISKPFHRKKILDCISILESN